MEEPSRRTESRRRRCQKHVRSKASFISNVHYSVLPVPQTQNHLECATSHSAQPQHYCTVSQTPRHLTKSQVVQPWIQSTYGRYWESNNTFKNGISGLEDPSSRPPWCKYTTRSSKSPPARRSRVTKPVLRHERPYHSILCSP